MKKFTVFCQQGNGRGTIWIDCVEAADLEEAKSTGQHECAEAWGYPPNAVHVLGVAEGNIKILHWEDPIIV